MAQYVKSTSIPVSKTKAKTRTKAPARRVTAGTFKLVIIILLIFAVAVALVNQYTKIVKVSTEINALEQEIRDTEKLIDTLEGRIINTANWDEIESIARTELNMVSPNEASYTVVRLHELPEAVKNRASSEVKEDGGSDESRFSLMIKELLGN